MNNPKLFVTLRHWFSEEEVDDSADIENTEENENNENSE